ncbi:hypothetical protein HZA40_02860 [Candidatus Peregrinibacteria bacterium]|nr:hypothetical protein [Candidatus Peregrinibacteria bacterium]
MKRLATLTFLSLFIFTACGNDPVYKKNESVITPNPSTTSSQDSSAKSPATPAAKLSKTDEAVKKSTYLMSQVFDLQNSAEQYCTKSKNQLLGDGNKIKFLIKAIDSQEVQTDLKRIIGNESTVKEFTKQAKAFYDANKSSDDMGDLIGVCKKGENIYVLFSPKAPGYFITLWKDQKSFEYFKNKLNGKESFGGDNAVSSLLIDALDGKSLVLTISKDIPDIYWTVNLLDPGTLIVTEIEKCTLKFEYTVKPPALNADSSTLSCEKQYKP